VKEMDAFQDELRVFAKSLGVDLFGVADLTGARDFILRQGGENIASYSRAISLGMRLLDAVVDELYRHEEPTALYSYQAHTNSVNTTLDWITLLLAKRVQETGFKAYPIPASQTINERRLEGAISHKLAANLAGHGWIGKNSLLVTPRYGPRVRLSTILTDAPLETGEPITDGCGDCVECVDICSEKAFTGVSFNPSEPRDVRFRAYLCSDYTERRSRRLGIGTCGLCVYACPKGSTSEAILM